MMVLPRIARPPRRQARAVRLIRPALRQRRQCLPQLSRVPLERVGPLEVALEIQAHALQRRKRGVTTKKESEIRRAGRRGRQSAGGSWRERALRQRDHSLADIRPLSRAQETNKKTKKAAACVGPQEPGRATQHAHWQARAWPNTRTRGRPRRGRAPSAPGRAGHPRTRWPIAAPARPRIERRPNRPATARSG